MKQWYQSRTLWLNIIGAVTYFLQNQFGFVLPPELQGYILIILNLALRLDTTTAIQGVATPTVK